MEARVGGWGLASELSDSPEKPGPDARLKDRLPGSSPLRTRRKRSKGECLGASARPGRSHLTPFPTAARRQGRPPSTDRGCTRALQGPGEQAPSW